MATEKTLTFREKFDHVRQTNYRLVVMNNETFEEIGSYRLTLMNLYVFLSSAFVGTALLVLGLIIFTPLKRYIPGVTPMNENEELLKMSSQIAKLEGQVSAQKTYYEGFRKMLTDKVESAPEKPDEELKQIPDSLLDVDRIAEDAQIRNQVAGGGFAMNTALDGSRQGSTLLMEKSLFDLDFKNPMSGIVSKSFDVRIKHYGIDITAPKGKSVNSTLDGIVISADWTLETGYTIGIQHNNNLISFYKHNSKLLKKVGEVVKANDAIALVGNTGALTDGAHLHFELWHRGKPIDPADYIDFMQSKDKKTDTKKDATDTKVTTTSEETISSDNNAAVAGAAVAAGVAATALSLKKKDDKKAKDEPTDEELATDETDGEEVKEDKPTKRKKRRYRRRRR
jgi:murein DD-endopeptidase MepM/ murein hydrolase activator NlpD